MPRQKSINDDTQNEFFFRKQISISPKILNGINPYNLISIQPLHRIKQFSILRRCQRPSSSDRGNNFGVPHQEMSVDLLGYNQNDILRTGNVHHSVHTLFHHPMPVRTRLHVERKRSI